MIRPLGDRVVIELAAAEMKTASGIVLPDSAKEKPQEGVVVAVGKGEKNANGEYIAMEVQVGDRVVFSKYAETVVKHEGKEYMLVRERDILAVLA